MSEEQLFASFEAAWTNDGFLSREHEEARLEAGREALRRFREEQLAPGRDHPGVGRARVQLLPRRRPGPRPVRPGRHRAARPRRARPGRWPTTATRPAAPTSSSRPSTCAPERVVDHRLQVVATCATRRRRASGRRTRSSSRSTRWRYEAMTGRLPDAVALHFLDSGLVGTAPVDRQADREGPRRRSGPRPAGIRARDFTAKPDYLSCSCCAVPRDLPVQRRPLTDGRARRRRTGAAIEAVARRRGARRGRRGGQPRRAARPCPTAASTLPTPTRRSRRARRSGWSVDPDRATATQTRRGFGGREYRYEVVSDLAWDDGLPLDAHLEALGARLVEGSTASSRRTARSTSTCDWRTVHHAAAAARRGVRAPRGSSTSSSGRTTTAAGTATAGRASTTRSCGTPRATDGCSTATRSTACRTWRRGSWGRRRRRAASCRPTCGG